MRRLALIGLFLPLSACGSSGSPYLQANELMGQEIANRVQQIPYQHRDELYQNLLWLAQSGEQAIPDLIEALGDNNPKVQSSCAWVLGRIGDRRTIGDLQEFSKDPHPTVRMEVARSETLNAQRQLDLDETLGLEDLLRAAEVFVNEKSEGGRRGFITRPQYGARRGRSR